VIVFTPLSFRHVEQTKGGGLNGLIAFFVLKEGLDILKLTQMTLIKPQTSEDRTSILGGLATNVARRMEIEMNRYDPRTVNDTSGTIHWMYIFDEHESRIYRTQNGTQRMADLEIPQNEMLDLDEIEDQIRAAIEKLVAENDPTSKTK
jgi:hypothetical protein